MPNPGPATSGAVNAQPLNSSQALRLLGYKRGVNVNATGDTLIPLINATQFSVDAVVFTNASTSLTTAAAGIFPSANAGGTAIVSNAALSALTGATVFSKRTINSNAVQTAGPGGSLYLNVGTAQGAAATMDVFVYGYEIADLP